MTNLSIIKLLGLIACTIPLVGIAASGGAANAKPNIVYILADDQGWRST